MATLQVVYTKNGNLLDIDNNFILKQHDDGIVVAIGVLVSDNGDDTIRELTLEERIKAELLGLICSDGEKEVPRQESATDNSLSTPMLPTIPPPGSVPCRWDGCKPETDMLPTIPPPGSVPRRWDDCKPETDMLPTISVPKPALPIVPEYLFPESENWDFPMTEYKDMTFEDWVLSTHCREVFDEWKPKFDDWTQSDDCRQAFKTWKANL